ncbi:hypothetical protein [Komagataeibacter swingsii]|nr:hypothetical protein [Komagataeibacter swingsii]
MALALHHRANDKEVFGEAFFKKLQGMPPFWEKAAPISIYYL